MNKSIASQTLEKVLKYGAQGARITISEGVQSSISLLSGEIDKLESSASAVLIIQMFVDGKYGIFSTNRMENSNLDEFIKNGIASSRLLSIDPHRSLPDPKRYYNNRGKDLNQCDKTFHEIEPQKKKELLYNIANEVDRDDATIISLSNEYSDSIDSEYMIDSQGLEVWDTYTNFTVSCECTIKGKGDDKLQNWWYDSSMFFDTLPKGCCKMAFERAIMMNNPKKIKSGRYAIVLENTVASRVVSPIIGALNGSSLQQKNSFLLDSIGKSPFNRSLTITDHPHLIGEMGSRYYDSEGICTKSMDIIRDGMICTYYLNTYYANKMNLPPTVDSPSSLIFENVSPFGQSEMIKKIGRGILITGFNGGNCNGATGDFSFGIEGYLFENGEIVHPIKEMNMTGNIISLWRNSLYIGNDPRGCARWKIPTLSFNDIDISGL